MKIFWHENEGKLYTKKSRSKKSCKMSKISLYYDIMQGAKVGILKNHLSLKYIKGAIGHKPKELRSIQSGNTEERDNSICR